MPQIDLNDIVLEYSRAGSGECLLFIQGVGCKGCAWQPQTGVLQSEFDCISFDNRGIGNSVGKTAGLSIEQMADDAVAILDAFQINQAHIIGHSMGGVIAHELALRYPDRVNSLSLMCTLHRGKDATTLTFGLLKNALLTSIGTISMRRKAFARMVSSPQYIAENGIDFVVKELSETFQRDLAKLPSVVKNQLRALSRHDSSHRLHQLSEIPSMVIAGSFDPIGRPLLAKRLAAAIRTKNLHIFDDASHAAPIQYPDRINRLLRNHILAASD
ncbi:MAG: alpha/beta hydrolase [Planctomycetota bacterium]